MMKKMTKKGHTKHRSMVMKSVMEDDLKNSTRDFSIETLQTESDQKDLKIKSYYVYPVKRMNDYDRNEVKYKEKYKLIDYSICLNLIL